MTAPERPLRQLDERDVRADPVAQFEVWFRDAHEAGIAFPEAMTLATATRDAAPSARLVLLKGLEPDAGFVFFTNHESRKGRELDENPRAALVFYWQPLGRQVRVEGSVERVSADEAEAYFRTRPRGSRIGAWASPQSRPIGRAELERRVEEAEARFGDGEIPLPPFWGGYRLRADALEFWQHRDDRLHDRLSYRRERGGWAVARLAP